MVYFGVSIGSGSFGGNVYLEFFLVSIIEIPSHYFAIKFMDRYDSLMQYIILLNI